MQFMIQQSRVCQKKKSPKFQTTYPFKMTYKELLYKMANMGMLTLSNDKDGRGLFWVGMDNMDALEKEFDWVDFKGCSDVKEKEYYTDKQGRKMEKHTNYEYVQPLFSEKNP